MFACLYQTQVRYNSSKLKTNFLDDPSTNRLVANNMPTGFNVVNLYKTMHQPTNSIAYTTSLKDHGPKINKRKYIFCSY